MTDIRTGWPALIICALLLAALQLYLRPLMPVDETRYLGVAWEMWRRGDFLVPYLNGEPYNHKPPLLFWLIHALWAVFGVSAWPARLLPVALALLALWWSAALAARLWPRDSAAVRALVPWLLFGGLFWVNFYTLVQFDLLLVLAALGAWHGVLRAIEGVRAGWPVVALAVGLGVLAKGPVILVPVLPAILLAPWWRRAPPAGGWGRWYAAALAALLAGAGIALLWAVPAGLAGGEAYRQAIFWGQSAGRMVASFAHRSPWWTYLLWLPLLWLPWVLWPPLWRAVRRLSAGDSGVRFCLAVLVPALLVFSLISGKQGKYLLPLLPLLAALSARALAGAPDALSRAWPAALLLALTGGALTLLPWWPQGPVWQDRLAVWWGPLALLLSFGLLRFRWPPAAAVRVQALAMVAATALVYATVVPLMAPQYRLQPLADRLAGLQREGGAIAWLGRYHGQFQFPGRLRRPVVALQGADALHAWLAAHPQGHVLVNYPQRRPEVPADLRVQPYRGGSLVLWPAQRLQRSPEQLDALSGNA